MSGIPKLKLALSFGLLLVGLLAVSVITPGKVAFAAADSCTPPATTYGTDTMTVPVPAAGTYSIWVRMMIPSTASNSILLSIDGTSCYNVGGSTSIPANTWTWVNYNDGSSANAIKLSLSQANHTFVLTGTNSGVSIDRIEALSDATCTPTGTGDNCTPVVDSTPPTVSVTAPVKNTTVSGTTAVTATAADNVGVTSVQFKLDGVNLGAVDTASPYTTSWNTTTATNGSHTLTAVASDAAGNTTTSVSVAVTVSNGTTTPPPVVGDLDADGHVTGHDLSIFLAHYGTNYAPAEFDGGTIVEGHDLSILLSNYGK